MTIDQKMDLLLAFSMANTVMLVVVILMWA